MNQEVLARSQQGKNVTIHTNGKQEEWRLINCPWFKDSDKDRV